jgi:hypothetical protein
VGPPGPNLFSRAGHPGPPFENLKSHSLVRSSTLDYAYHSSFDVRNMDASKIKIIRDAAVEMTEGRYVPHEIRDPASALQASLHLVLKHTADMFVCVLEAISEKYGHSVEEMTAVVMAHPGYKEMMVSPVLHDLGYLSKKKVAPPAAAVAEDPGPAAPATAAVAEAKEMTDAWRAAKKAARQTPPPPKLPPLRRQQADTAAIIAEIDEILLAGPPPSVTAPLPPLKEESSKKFIIRPRVKAAWVGAGNGV